MYITVYKMQQLQIPCVHNGIIALSWILQKLNNKETMQNTKMTLL